MGDPYELTGIKKQHNGLTVRQFNRFKFPCQESPSQKQQFSVTDTDDTVPKKTIHV